MRHYLGKIHAFFSKQNGLTIIVIALMVIALLGWLDYKTGTELTFSYFYLLPIGLTAIYTNLAVSEVIAAISIIVWMVTNKLAGEAYSDKSVEYWNAIIRVVVLSLYALLLYELKKAIAREREMARTDFLTNVNNRRELYRVAELEILRARRYDHPFAVAYIDLDFFKQVNDKQGHAAGDNVLREIAGIMKNSVRKTDTLARMGGDEFVILLPEIDAVGAKRVLEKTKNNVTSNASGHEIRMTFSAGLVHFRKAPQSVDGLIEKADQLMYQAKLQGKDCILFMQVE